ncbi:hypothetical protein Q5752_000870 [Cryptotrichosporon argae]
MSRPPSQPPLPHASSSSDAKKRKLDVRAKERTASVDMTTEDEAGSPSAASVSARAAAHGAREAKRTRVHFSCVECHRRKQKCDRKEPCSQCVARRVPNLCRPFLNGVEDPNSNPDVNARLSTIENLLSSMASFMPQILSRLNIAPVDGSSSSPDVSSLAPTGDDIFHPQSQPGDARPQVFATKPPPSGIFPGMLAAAPSGRNVYGWGLKDGRVVSLDVEGSPELEGILATLRESGVSKHHLEWLIASVPGKRMADSLVNLYFRDIDWTRYKINRPSFERKYRDFFDSLGRGPGGLRIDGDTLRWLPLLFIVLAIASLSAPPDVVPVDEQGAWSRRFYGSARSGLEYAKALQRDNLDVLFAGLLASRYMLLIRRPAEGSTPMTTAFQLGLYRDGTVLNITDKREIEIRRRAWAMLYHLDRTISLLVGRPANISDAHTDTRPPANLDDEDVEGGEFDPEGHPLSVPTMYTYVIVRHQLAQIMGRIAYHTFAIALPDYGTVVALDKELLDFRDRLPRFLCMQNADASFDATHPYLFVQRHLLASEWYYARITLNRPYLLRRKPQDERYAYSKIAAIESAKADLLNRRAFNMKKGHLVINSGGYRVLNSFLVLGVTIKLDPDSPQADELRHLLNVVSGRIPDAKGETSEPIVKEELGIVDYLTAKSAPRPALSLKTGSDEQTADVLLELAQTNSGRRAAEEERRQMRLQQRREADEVRLAARARQINGGGAAPGQQHTGAGAGGPWGYVAPSLVPGFDVHQPFGQQRHLAPMRREPHELRGPKPLQPPPKQGEWDEAFGLSDLGMYADGADAGQGQHAHGHVFNPLAHYDSAPADGGVPMSVGVGVDVLAPDGMGPNAVLGQLGSVDTMFADDLALGVGLGPFASAGQAPAGTQQEFQAAAGAGDMFNPFAIAQMGDEGTANEPSPDEMTAYLNHILNTFANSQPEIQ